MSDSDRPIIPWRFVAGVLLHFALPGYVVTVLVVLMASGQPLLLAPTLRLTLLTAAWFVPGYGLVILLLAAGAMYADPLLRRRRAAKSTRDPAVAARESERRVAASTETILTIAASGDGADRRISDAVSLLLKGPWGHGDRAFQRLSSDLAMAVRAFVASSGHADAAHRHDIRLLAATALERLAGELRRLNRERERLEHGNAKVAARYIELRYGSDDFSGDSPG